MRMSILFLLAVLARQKETRGPWDGFKTGSWILTELKRQGKHTLPPDYTQRHSIDRGGTRGSPLLRIRTKSSADPDSREAAPAQPHGELSSLTKGMKEESRRPEKFAVGERQLDCTVVEYLGDGIPLDHPRTMPIWKADGVSFPPREMGFWAGRVVIPPDVVQMLSVHRNGDSVETWKLKALDLSATLSIGAEKLDYSIEEVRYTRETPDRPTLIRGRRRWICDAVPGRVARREEECRAGASGGCYTAQVVDFKALR